MDETIPTLKDRGTMVEETIPALKDRGTMVDETIPALKDRGTVMGLKPRGVRRTRELR